MNIKNILAGVGVSVLMLGSMATVVLAAPPTVGTSPAAPNAQCDTHAASGAFNFRNEVYGAPSSLNDSLNSSEFGLAGGSGGGQTGLNNSGVCGNRQGNL